jgi:hypothetical protein
LAYLFKGSYKLSVSYMEMSNADGQNLRHHIDRQFSRVRISINDMERAVEFAAVVAAGNFAQDQTLLRALITAAIVSYARPFSGNQDHEKATATPPDVLRRLTAEERKLHDTLCEIRNQAIAHSDFTMNPVGSVEYHSTGVSLTSRMYDPLSESLDIHAMQALAEKMRVEFQNKIFELAQAGAKYSGS